MTRQNERGFTLLEILIMSPIVMLTIVIIISYLFNQYGQLIQQGSQLNLNVEAQNITFSMQDDLFFANAYTSGINSGLVDAYQPTGGWKAASTPQTLIVSVPAETANHRSASRQPVYINTLGCEASVLTDNSPLYNNVIYFVSGTNLYKRYITAPSTMNTCGTSYQKQTCPSSNATSSCPADRLLSDKLSSFTVTYYDTSNTVTTTPELAEKVKIDVQLKDKAYAEDIFSSSSITLRKIN
jgi:competence protein ComGC